MEKNKGEIMPLSKKIDQQLLNEQKLLKARKFAEKERSSLFPLASQAESKVGKVGLDALDLF